MNFDQLWSREWTLLNCVWSGWWILFNCGIGDEPFLTMQCVGWTLFDCGVRHEPWSPCLTFSWTFSCLLSSCLKFFIKFRQIAPKVIACIPPWLPYFPVFWLKLDENSGSSSLFKILTLEILQSAPNDPKLNSKNRDMKSMLYMHFLGLRGPNFHPFYSMIMPLSRNCTFCYFPIDSHINISKCHKLLKLVWLPTKLIVFRHGRQCPHKV